MKAPDIERIVERLRARVEERRRSNQYPPDLEEELAEHFRRIVARGALKDHPPLGNMLAPVRASKTFDPGLIHSDSEKPAGRFFHQAVAKLVSRQTQGILEQVSRFAEAVDRALGAMADRIEEPTHIRNELASRIDAMLERLAAYERAPIDTPQGFLEISRRVEELEAFVRSQHVRPWYDLTRFEEALHYSQKDYSDRHSPWAAKLEAHSPVLDIGSGTGSFLKLLLERGVQAEGVESDPVSLEIAIGHGLPVAHADPLEYLASRVDEDLGGASVIQRWSA
ncbi:MAG: class I SAM-dependent methyltransferase [Actinobacteria bacterium]|nr:class I SAM-dependent methyltransferase [Actinomycetota bacterium]